MRKGRIKRNAYSLTLGTLALVVSYCCNITPSKINNYTDVMSGILSFSSITTGLLFASFSLIPALPNSKLLDNLKRLKTDQKLLDRLLFSILGFLMCSIFALLALLFNAQDSSFMSRIVISLLIGVLIFSVSEQFKVLIILMKTVETM